MTLQIDVNNLDPQWRSWGRILKRKGVILDDPERTTLRCAECNDWWCVNYKSGGKLPRGYWRCPNGCNQHHKKRGAR